MADAGDGKTVIEHLRRVQRQAGRTPPEMVLPEVPDCATYLAQAFGELSRQRGSTGFGPQRLSIEAIHGWARARGFAWTAWEIETIGAMDAALLGKLNAAKEA